MFINADPLPALFPFPSSEKKKENVRYILICISKENNKEKENAYFFVFIAKCQVYLCVLINLLISNESLKKVYENENTKNKTKETKNFFMITLCKLQL